MSVKRYVRLEFAINAFVVFMGLSYDVGAAPSADVLKLTSANRSAYPASVEGTFADKDIRIPTQYLVGPVIFEDGGPSLHEGSPRDGHKVLKDFSLRIRLSNLSPVMTEQDENDWQRALSQGAPIFYEDWMIVDVDNRSNEVARKKFDTLAWVMRDPLQRGPFVKDPKQPFGLNHYVSSRSVDSNRTLGKTEYFYDPILGNSISCETKRRFVPPYDTFDTCEDRFFSRSFNIYIKAFITKKDLYRWKQIEERVNATLDSFIQR